MAAILPDFLITYLEQRDAARADDVTAVLAALTDRERALVKDAAVMGYVRGTMAPKGEPIPKDRAILAEVIDACLAFPDLYPAVCADPDPGADEAQQPDAEEMHQRRELRRLELLESALIDYINRPGTPDMVGHVLAAMLSYTSSQADTEIPEDAS